MAIYGLTFLKITLPFILIHKKLFSMIFRCSSGTGVIVVMRQVVIIFRIFYGNYFALLFLLTQDE